MTFTTAVVISVLFLLGAAILGGLIVYFLMRSKTRIYLANLNKLEKEYKNLQNSCIQKQKELELEIAARDKKISYLQSDNQALKSDISAETVDSELKFDLDTANAKLAGLQMEYDLLKKELEKEETGASSGSSNALQLQLNNLKRELKDLKEAASQRESLMQQELDAAHLNYDMLQKEYNRLSKESGKILDKTDKKDKKAEKEKKKSEKKKEEEGISKKDKKAQLEILKEKAKTFDYSTIGLASKDEKDDLKLIVGIGPFIEEKLNALKIYTFEQISRFNADDIARVTDAIEFFPGRIERDDWVSQAKELANKK